MENKIGNISSIENDTTLQVKSDNSVFAENFYFKDFFDDRCIKKFIKNTERLIRTSREYSDYIELLRTNCTVLNHDNILHNITTSDVDLEFHHYPFTLYDIIEIIMNEHISAKKNFNTFSIAKLVMELHYKHLIGLVPLTKTTHELAHSGNLFFSEAQVFGNYKEFLKTYGNYLTADMRNKYNEFIKNSASDINSDFGGLL